MNAKLLVAILLAGFAFTSCPKNNTTTLASSASKVKIIYIANEGFLIESAGKRILVDALFRESMKPYLNVPANFRNNLEMSQKPFDRIDLILASHFHADHFDPVAVSTHLTHNADALFISTSQAIEKMKSTSTDFESIKGRTRGLYPKEGDRVELTHRGIKLQVLNVHHGRNRPIENLGLLWEIAGRKFLHVGDSMANAEDFKNYDVLKDKLDFAFLPYWYFLDADFKKAVRDYIQPKYIVLMHIPDPRINDEYMNKLGGWENWFKQVKSEFPNAIIFNEQMQEKSFD